MNALSRKGKAARSRKGQRSSFPSPQQQQLEASKPRAIVENLQAILAKVDSMPLPVGETGREFLDCLKLTEKIIERFFTKAREQLKREPHSIPGWSCNETPQRVLSKDTLEIFDTLARADDTLSAENFIGACCSVSLTAIRKLLAQRNPDWDADRVEREINHTLTDVIHYEEVAQSHAPQRPSDEPLLI